MVIAEEVQILVDIQHIRQNGAVICLVVRFEGGKLECLIVFDEKCSSRAMHDLFGCNNGDNDECVFRCHSEFCSVTSGYLIFLPLVLEPISFAVDSPKLRVLIGFLMRNLSFDKKRLHFCLRNSEILTFF